MSRTGSPRARHRTWILGYGAAGAFTFLAASALATPASAQTLEYHWTGFKIEGILGYDNEGVDFDSDVFNGGKQSQSGLLYGVGVGYDFQTGAAVLGVEGEFSESGAGKTDHFSGNRPVPPINPPPPATPVTTSISYDAADDFYVGVRAGYLVSPDVLLYLKGGYTHTKIDVSGKGTEGAAPFSFDHKVSLDGFRLGAGGEWMFTPNFYTKLEYRYSNYNNGNIDVRGANVSLDPLFTGIDVVRHQVALGFGYRF